MRFRQDSKITEARTGAPRAGVVAKPSPLGDERGEFEGGWAMVVDVTNPSFPRAIPHGTVIIDLLTKGVLFGVFSGCRRAVSRGGFQTPSGSISKGCPGAF